MFSTENVLTGALFILGFLAYYIGDQVLIHSTTSPESVGRWSFPPWQSSVRDTTCCCFLFDRPIIHERTVGSHELPTFHSSPIAVTKHFVQGAFKHVDQVTMTNHNHLKSTPFLLGLRSCEVKPRLASSAAPTPERCRSSLRRWATSRT